MQDTLTRPRAYVGRGNHRCEFSDLEQKQIAAAYVGGATSEELGARHMVSRSTIDRVLAANNVVKRPRGPQPCRVAR